MFDEFRSTIHVAEVDNVRADGSIVLRLSDGNYAMLTAEQVDVAKVASDSERRAKLQVVR